MRFETPTSKPITIGDQFDLFRRSVRVPTVDTIPEEKTVSEEKQDDEIKDDSSAQDDDSEEKPAKKSRTEESPGSPKKSDQGDEDKGQEGTGGKDAKLPVGGAELESSGSKDRESSDSVLVKRKHSDTEQASESGSSSGEVQ